MRKAMPGLAATLLATTLLGLGASVAPTAANAQSLKARAEGRGAE